MRCNNCGRDIPDHSITCPECGAPVAPQPQQSTFERFNQMPQQPYQQPYAQNGYYQPPYAPTMGDPAEDDAKKSKIFGIVSLFFLHIIFGIIAIVKAKSYEKNGNGTHASDAKVGKVCGIIGICLEAVSCILVIICFFTGMFLGFKEISKNPEAYFERGGSYSYYDDEFDWDDDFYDDYDDDYDAGSDESSDETYDGYDHVITDNAFTVNPG